MVALIPAAGQGARFTNKAWPEGNKLFAPLLGKPILRWTVEALASHPRVDRVVVISSAEEAQRCRSLLSGITKVSHVIPGGRSRQESVANGLAGCECKPDDLIAIHDGARPLLSHEVISRCWEGARASGSAAAALPVVDTLKEADKNGIITKTVDRSALWAVQTPQCFRFADLQAAHQSASVHGFSGTDEASLMEAFGNSPVHLVRGAPENIKITHAEDLVMAESLLRARTSSFSAGIRVGFGYDIHRLVPGRRLMLGGIEIPSESGLEGHSDADVLLHALMDALLGAAALPDIGNLFPNTDPAYAGADSRELLTHVVGRLRAENYQIINADLTLIAETPKIAPFVPAMREAISERLTVLRSQVGIKATTHEGLGALGAGLGMAAHAVVSIAPLPGG
jgi:2-C-methyl-D-erythritol 4-phosphate cytidylyltransferase/2-C-methyl-D-erythritol 2,4-cyclodiphosphate synthase